MLWSGTSHPFHQPNTYTMPLSSFPRHSSTIVISRGSRSATTALIGSSNSRSASMSRGSSSTTFNICISGNTYCTLSSFLRSHLLPTPTLSPPRRASSRRRGTDSSSPASAADPFYVSTPPRRYSAIAVSPVSYVCTGLWYVARHSSLQVASVSTISLATPRNAYSVDVRIAQSAQLLHQLPRQRQQVVRRLSREQLHLLRQRPRSA